MNSKRNKLRTGFLALIILCAIAAGVLACYNLSLPKGTKTLVLEQGEKETTEVGIPQVVNVKALNKQKGDLQGYLGDKLVFLAFEEENRNSYAKRISKVSLYDPAGGNRRLPQNIDRRLQLSAFGLFGIAPDKSKMLLLEIDDWGSNFRGVDTGVYMYDINSEKTVEVVNLKVDKGYPVLHGIGWSPDNRHITYGLKEGSENSFDFFVYDVNTANTVKYHLAEKEGRFNELSLPQLSSDGRYIYFVGHFRENTQSIGTFALYRMDLQRPKKDAELMTSDVDYYYLTADGRNIIFTSGYLNSAKRGIYIFDTVTKGEKRVVEKQFWFDVSADGKQIIYSDDGGNSLDIRVANLVPGGMENSTSLYKFGPNKEIRGLYWNAGGSGIVAAVNNGKSGQGGVLDVTNYIIEFTGN